MEQTKQQENKITDSRYNMWRAVFAMAHADDQITEQEEKFMSEALSEYDFTELQYVTLKNDMRHQADINYIFKNITDRNDRSDFFKYARLMVWCDGDFDEQEREIFNQLKSLHFTALSEEELKTEVHTLFNAQEKKKMKKRMASIYKSLQENQAQKGGYFGAVVRKMWADTKSS